MNRPLTNDEIRDLPSLGIRGGPTYPISCRAQAMIRELQEENEHRKLSVEHQISKRKSAEAENANLRDFILREGYRECDTAACNCGSFHDHRRHVKLDRLEADNTKLWDMLEVVLMKLEDYHKYAEPEKNAFIENMPIHIRATLKETKNE